MSGRPFLGGDLDEGFMGRLPALFARLGQTIDRLLAPALVADVAARFRARLLAIYIFVLLLVGPPFAVMYVVDGQAVGAALVLGAVVLGAPVLWWLGRARSLVGPGHWGVAVYFACQITLLALSGGWDLGTLYWTMFTPVIATFLVGYRGGALWLALSTAAVAVVAGGPGLGLFTLPQLLTTPGRLLDGVSAVMMTVLSVVFALLYELNRRATLDALVVERGKLADARASAEAANAAKTAFLANVSHEIRTPLNGILGITDMLLDEELAPEVRAEVETIHGAADALTRMMNDVIDLARIESGHAVMNDDVVRPRKLVESVVALFRPRAKEKGLTLTAVVDEGAPAALRTDEGKVRQILVNLIGNAIRYTDEGSVTVRVGGRVDGDAATLELAVKDTGPGIPGARVDAIWQPFTQVDASPRRRYGGAGLGLAITRQLTELLGGTIDVTTREGAGSTFRVVLRGPHVARAATPTPPPMAVGLFVGRRVLVAEDNAVNQHVLVRMLEREGIAPDVVVDGAAAVVAASTTRYDAILMDCQMPELDGYEATRAIRAREGDGPHTPIIAVTASMLAEDRAAVFAAGMDDYLAKPVVADALRVALARALLVPSSTVDAPSSGPSSSGAS